MTKLDDVRMQDDMRRMIGAKRFVPDDAGSDVEVALSVRQPWAWAIIHAGKSYENRVWSTEYRGPLLIHAAKGMTRGEYGDFCEFVFQIAESNMPSMPPFEELRRGGIIGHAVVVGCVHERDKSLLREPDRLWFFGPYGIALHSAAPLEFVPMAGRLGLFKVRGRWER